jgi:hypothetical protein
MIINFGTDHSTEGRMPLIQNQTCRGFEGRNAASQRNSTSAR